MAGQMLSMICSGVVRGDAGPAGRVAVETGIAWAGVARRGRWTTPGARSARRRRTGLRRPPSEYLRAHWWFTTQPIEEPDDPEHLALAFDALGMADRIVFSSDYPHWDFDAPSQTLPPSISREDKARILAGNACRLYDLPRR